jgi:hypothetical protein
MCVGQRRRQLTSPLAIHDNIDLARYLVAVSVGTVFLLVAQGLLEQVFNRIPIIARNLQRFPD